MRQYLRKTLLITSALCLCMLLAGTISAEDNTTYEAYPGSPTPATGPHAVGQTTVVQQSVTSVQTGKPVIQLGSVGRASNTVSSTITATYTNQAPAATQQRVLLPYSVQTDPPKAVYYSGTFMPWTAFSQSFSANSPALWVASSQGWSWDARCPVGGWIQNLMYVPYTGTMKLYEFYPDGSIKLYSYGFSTPGYKYIWFYADTPGRHITLFTIFDKPSNYITIDVF